MLCETPIIGTKGTDIWRELEEGGATIAERTPTAFADAIEKITSNPELANTIGKKGRKKMLAWLDSDVVGEQCEKMYQNAISAR
jgi:glycosyltransferase involved in cell wall biosynthesis